MGVFMGFTSKINALGLLLSKPNNYVEKNVWVLWNSSSHKHYISLKFLFAASLDETVEHGINQNDSVLEEVGL